MASVLSKSRSLAARTVHIKISPSARTFRECREVLLELEEKCGEVAMFRSLKYHPTSPVPNAALAVFQTESAAQKALNLTPFTYGVIIEQAQSINTFVGPPGPPLPLEAFPESPLEASNEEPTNENKPEAEKREEKWFQLDVSPSDFVHEKYIKSTLTNPLYGPYRPVKPETSFLAATLNQTVLPSLWARGLRDWETDAVRRRPDLKIDAEDERRSAGSSATETGTRKGRSFYEERFRKRHEKTLPRVMKGLRALREERERRDMEAEVVREDVG